MSISLVRCKEITALSAPIIGIQFAQVALTSTDLLMMGLLSVQALAAGGMALLLYNQLRTMCVGMVTGVGNMIAGAAGAGEKRSGNDTLDRQAIEEIHDLVRSSLLLATVVSIVAAAILVALGFGLTLAGQSPQVAALARPIMATLSLGLIPMLWLNVLRQFAVGMRRPGSLLGVTIASIAVNALLNAVFIFGWLGIPKLGLAGIGIATTLVQLWTVLVYLRWLLRDKTLRPLLAFNIWRARPDTLKRIVSMGIPISLTYGSEAAITSVATVLMGTFGPLALAASNIVNQLAYIVYQLNIGLSHGASILISRLHGKGDVHLVRDIGQNTLAISFTLMAAIALVYIVLPGAVLWPFVGDTHDPVLYAMASTLLWFAIVHQYAKGSQNICIGLMRGLGNTKAGFSSTLIGYWVVGIPCMLLCAYGFGWQGYGVWGGLCIGFATTSVLLWRRFHHATAQHHGLAQPE
ncbi:MATE family efflux transporter [Carnimonas bestiolae]|uniref:MATE family efflux transporter n=1 Tax=Carnimonas bestiolae TaxID=3402172 RepID=UPI003EDC744A